jgi:hypothetical protein
MAERRQVPRYHYHGDADLVIPATGQTIKITLNTLSVQGCRGECTESPAIGQICALSLHWEGKEFQTEAEVMWKNAKSQIGLRFLTMDDVHLKLLRNLCSELQVQPLTVLPHEPDKVKY